MEPTQNIDASMSRYTAGFSVSAMIVFFLNMGLVWAKELHPPLKAFMKSVSGHHWTTHGITMVVTFLLLGFLLSRSTRLQQLRGITSLLVASVILSALGILGFYVLHYFKAF